MPEVYSELTPASMLDWSEVVPSVYAPAMDEWTKEDRAKFGLRLKQARVAVGLTQSDVAAIFGDMKKATVSAWETGKNMPNVEQLARLADEYKVACEALIFGVGQAPLSKELRARLAELDQDRLRTIENMIRAGLDMPMIQRPFAPAEKRSVARAA